MDTFAIGGSGDLVALGTTKYYTIPVQTGVTPYISATLVPEEETGNWDYLGVRLALWGEDGQSCASNQAGQALTSGRNAPATALIDNLTFGGPEALSWCPTDGVAVLEVARVGQAWADRPLEMEIVVRMEPPADAGDLLPQASTGAELPALTHGVPAALTGGSSFNDAPRLTSGSTYQDSLFTGESRFYRIPLEWGQRMSYLITENGPGTPSLGYVRSPVFVDLFNPVRGQVTASQETTGRLWFGDDRDKPFSASTPYPVRYTNRGGVDQRGYALDGDYFLRINADRHDDEPSSTSYLITVVISGEVEQGPVYQPIGDLPTSQMSVPSTVSFASSGPSGTSSSAGPPSGSETTSVSATGQASPVAAGPGGWLWFTIGGLAVAVVAVLVVLLIGAARSRWINNEIVGRSDRQPGCDRHR